MLMRKLLFSTAFAARRPGTATSLCTPNVMKHFSSSAGAEFMQHSAKVPGGQVSSSDNMTSLKFSTNDHPGALEIALGVFRNAGVNLTHLSSRPSNRGPHFNFFVDFESAVESPTSQNILKELASKSVKVEVQGAKEVPWFPKKISDIDYFVVKTLDAGGELDSDHPGFSDPVYRQRRDDIASIALSYKSGEDIPRLTYTAEETATWGTVYNKLQDLFQKYACQEYLAILPELEKHCGYAPDNIPQLQDISDFLHSRTGFRLRPVTGLLSARDFLNGLAFKVFFSTQYIRHHSVPLYTPEPDICHELMGHAPMFADPDFASFSHEIGLASLGASDEDIARLATCYWYSVEFGLLRQGSELKAYGAGTLSSFGELEYSCSPSRPAGGTDDMPQYKPWNPFEACDKTYPITTYQPTYYVASSLADAKDRMIQFCNSLTRPFHVRHDAATDSIIVDRAVKRGQPPQKE